MNLKQLLKFNVETLHATLSQNPLNINAITENK